MHKKPSLFGLSRFHRARLEKIVTRKESRIKPMMLVTKFTFYQLYLSASVLFVAYLLLLVLAAVLMPHGIKQLPVFGIYVLANMILLVLAMLCSCFVTKIYNYSGGKQLSGKLNRVTIHCSQFKFLSCWRGWSTVRSLGGEVGKEFMIQG